MEKSYNFYLGIIFLVLLMFSSLGNSAALSGDSFVIIDNTANTVDLYSRTVSTAQANADTLFVKANFKNKTSSLGSTNWVQGPKIANVGTIITAGMLLYPPPRDLYCVLGNHYFFYDDLTWNLPDSGWDCKYFLGNIVDL